MEFCAMCGTQKCVRRRTCVTEDLQERVRKTWLEGPFVYPSVMSISTEHCICCETCVRMTRQGKRKTMMPMDQFLVWLMSPRSTIDMRLWRRMREALTGGPNPFGCVGNFAEAAAAEDPVLAWWERNERTQFFRHKDTARAVRAAMRTAIY
jgi:hypothetical protein